MISSGQDYPLSDQSGSQSIFADAVLDALEENDTILPAPALFLAVRDQLDPGTLDVQFKAIKGAGDAVGDFYLCTAFLIFAALMLRCFAVTFQLSAGILYR